MDAATSGRSTRDRAATADTMSGSAGDLIPVLMRIPDVRPPARGKAKRETVASIANGSIAATTPPAAPTSPASDSYKPSFEIEYPSEATKKEKTIHLEEPVREEVAASTEKVAERAIESAVTAAKENPPSPEDANESPTPAANESASQPGTNRRQRQRRPATEPQSSWWKTQGRALAAVFVIALGVTIYFARAPRGNTIDAARDDETSDVEITSSAITDDTLDAVRPSHTPHVASKPKTSAPPLADQHVHDEELLDDAAAGDESVVGLDEAEDVEHSIASAEEGDHEMEDDVTATEIDFGELPDSYPETDREKYPSDGPRPRTAQNPNPSSTR